MVKDIVRDPMFLQQKSEPATEADKQVIQDLLDSRKEISEKISKPVRRIISR